MVAKSALRPFVLMYTRNELPAWGRVMALAGGNSDAAWQNTPLVRTRYKWTQYHVWLNLANPFERYVYFCGRYYDLGPQLALRQIIRRGSTFVDVGANIGLMTVLGAHAVGPNGAVYAFEPNDECCERLQLHIDKNRLHHVRLQPIGLSDADDTLSLTSGTGHSVHGSFAPPVEVTTVTTRRTATVRKGDDCLVGAPIDRPMFIKIDVEGFECRALRGLAATIHKHQPVILTEVVPAHLAQAGSSVNELFDLMNTFGYGGSAVTTVRRWARYRLRLTPAPTAKSLPQEATDVLWRHGLR